MPTHFENADKSNDENNQITQYENSYNLESKNPFKVDGVEKIVKTVMHNNLEDASYDPEECPKRCNQIAAEIQKRMQKLNFDRYKIVVGVTIIEKASQSMVSSAGFLWDPERDNCVMHTFETMTFLAYCYVFGVYYE